MDWMSIHGNTSKYATFIAHSRGVGDELLFFEICILYTRISGLQAMSAPFHQLCCESRTQ